MFSGSPEVKFIDVTSSLASNTTGAIALLNGIVPGTSATTRVGRRTMVVSVQGNFLSRVTTGTGVDQVQRVMLVRDQQTNGAALTIADVLAAVNTDAQVNVSNALRFKILLDRRFYLNASAEPGSGIVWSFKCNPHALIQFNAGTAGTVADITTGSMYLISIGSQAPGATAGDTQFTTRVSFTDI